MKIQNSIIIGTNSHRKYLFILLLMVLSGILSLGIRAWWGSATELKEAERALIKKEYFSAIIHYEKVLFWNFPIFGYKNMAETGIKTITQRVDTEKRALITSYARDALAFASASTQGFSRDRTYFQGKGLPDPLWSAVVGISLLAWIGLTLFLIAFIFNDKLVIPNKTLFFITLTILVLVLFLWIYSMHRL